MKVDILANGWVKTIEYRKDGNCSRLCGWLQTMGNFGDGHSIGCKLFRVKITNMHTGPRCQQCIDAEKNSGGAK